MKGLPEKLVMAAIILTCGLVAHTGPSAQDHPARHVTAGSLHIWQALPCNSAAVHVASVSKAFTARAE